MVSTGEAGKTRIPPFVVVKYIGLSGSIYKCRQLFRNGGCPMIPNQLTDYLESLIPERDKLLQEMEQYAKEHQVPIMELVGIEALLQILRLFQPKTVLEIGTAIGYSAIRMAKALPATNIITIERDGERYEKALYFIKQAGLSDRIHVHYGDALELAEELADKSQYDAIFIDAAKGQYTRFFELYTKALRSQGVVISDNVLFRGLVAKTDIDNKRLGSLTEKIKTYNKWLIDHPGFDTAILPVGDGIAISKMR